LQTITKLGGKHLAKKNTMYQTLKEVYPNYEWKAFRFLNMKETEWQDLLRGKINIQFRL
jgi:hypothetical protein